MPSLRSEVLRLIKNCNISFQHLGSLLKFLNLPPLDQSLQHLDRSFQMQLLKSDPTFAHLGLILAVLQLSLLV